MQPSREDILAIMSQEARIERERLVPDASLATLGIASLDMVSVLFAIEDRFGVEIPPEAMVDVATVEQFVDRIADRIAAA